IYAKQVAAVMDKVTIKGISHVTGGGFYENFPRVMPEGLGGELDKSAREVPEIFSFIKETGIITEKDMYGVFSLGVGMTLFVVSLKADSVVALLYDSRESAG